MAAPKTSRIPKFYQKTVEERRAMISEVCALSPAARSALDGSAGLSEAIADKMIENVVGTFSLPVGLGLNFVIDGEEVVVPMVVEEPSIVAAVSNIANLVRKSGGFTTSSTPPEMIAQVQIVDIPDFDAAKSALLKAKQMLMERGNEMLADIVRFGGGMRDIEVRQLESRGDGGPPMLVVHLIVDCRDAMGANTVNTLAEGLAPTFEQLTSGRVVLRILSNLADRRLARASCRIPIEHLAIKEMSGAAVAENLIWAYRFAARDPYRAATHNKGIMNGIDAVAVATGNDWRAIEAGAHAYAARSGHYTSLTTYTLEDDHLCGSIELPMAVGTVGGATRVHPTVKACYELLGTTSADKLGRIMAAVGLSQNLGALKALATVGIQRGHMALHARQVALAAGATHEQVDAIAQALIEKRAINLEAAKALLQEK